MITTVTPHVTTILMDRSLFLPFLSLVQRVDLSLDDLDEHKVISLLSEVIEKIRKDNARLIVQQVQIQVTI